MSERSIATILLTDIVGATERAAQMGDCRWRKFPMLFDRATYAPAAGHVVVKRPGGVSQSPTGERHKNPKRIVPQIRSCKK